MHEAKQSAWSHFFNQALSDLTGMMEDQVVTGGVEITTPWSAEKLADRAGEIADAAVAKLEEREIDEDYWPTSPE